MATLTDLFQSYAQLKPFEYELAEMQIDPLYENYNRAKSATQAEQLVDTVTNAWKVGGSTTSPYKWKVGYMTDEPISTEIQNSTVVQNNENNNQFNDGSKVTNIKWKNIYKGKREEWLKDMVQAYKAEGLSKQAIINLLAKNIWESGWGEHAQGNFNFGNITAGSSWKGKIVLGNDTDKHGRPITQKWRSYDSLQHYVQDEIQFLQALYNFNKNGDDFETFLSKLQDGKRRYAEALTYKDNLRSVLRGATKRVEKYG